MDLSEVSRFRPSDLDAAYRAGLRAFDVPEQKSLERWARDHFYLSAESSYVEQEWTPWPFQSGILHLMGSDDVEIFSLRKSARVGYTKMLLADVCYNAQHRRRNQCVWQPTDDDQKDFVQTDLDPALRDVKIMKSVFPAFMQRHKDNTLDTKRLLGCNLFARGAKAAKNFRRLTLDVAILDEIDGMDRDIENEGTPTKLAWKRTEGATFRKLIAGTTPKIRGRSHIEDLEDSADIFVEYCFRCPHCHAYHPLRWGGKEESHGFKWSNEDPDTVTHFCASCGEAVTQAEYTAAAESGHARWQTADGLVLHIEDDAPVFRTLDGTRAAMPRRISAYIWTAYSPSVTWPEIVREFLEAMAKAAIGDKSLLKTFFNTTLGWTWAEDVEKTNAEELIARAKPLPLGTMPLGCLVPLCAVDTQDAFLHVLVWGVGRGGQMWPLDRKIIHGCPGEDAVWKELDEYRHNIRFTHASGQQVRLAATAIDTGGHYTHAVYNYVARNANQNVFAIKGRSGREKAIKDGSSKVDIDWKGRLRKHGVVLWHVGTNFAKDLIWGRLQIERPGPGYIHFSNSLPDEFYKQLAGEQRIGNRWEATRKRVEDWDCTTYVVWLETHLELHRKSDKWWDALEARIQPATADLFAAPAVVAPTAAPAAEPAAEIPTPQPPKPRPAVARRPAPQPKQPARQSVSW